MVCLLLVQITDLGYFSTYMELALLLCDQEKHVACNGDNDVVIMKRWKIASAHVKCQQDNFNRSTLRARAKMRDWEWCLCVNSCL